jgi:hypothetical protein
MDCTKGYGPETITLARLEPGTYRYRVNHFGWDNKGPVSQPLLDSEAQVTLYTSDYQRQYIVGLNGYVDVSAHPANSFSSRNTTIENIALISDFCVQKANWFVFAIDGQAKEVAECTPLSCPKADAI